MTLEPEQAWKMKEILFQAYFVDGQDLSDHMLVEELFTFRALRREPA